MGNISDVTGYDDYSGVEPNKGFEPIPAGWYPCRIDNADVVPTKKGAAIKVELTVVGESHSGRKIWDYINIKHSESPKCEEFGARQLAALQLACGLVRLPDTSLLLGKVVDTKLAVSSEPNQKGDYENDVKGYRALDGVATQPVPVRAASAPSVASAPPRQAAPAQAANKPALPWMNR
jgi:hypothetical protein